MLAAAVLLFLIAYPSFIKVVNYLIQLSNIGRDAVKLCNPSLTHVRMGKLYYCLTIRDQHSLPPLP